MSTESPKESVKIAIVGMTGSGKTVLISTLAMKMAQMALEDIFMAPFGDNRRQTLRYTQSNWKTLNEGRWPASTPAGELIQLQWELTTKDQQAQVQFLDCAGQDIRSLFRTDYFNPNSLTGDLKKVYENIHNANILIFLVNMKDLLATPDYVEELMDLDQMFHTLNQRNDIPRKMAVVFSQFDKYKPEVDQKFNGDFLEYLRNYVPYLHGQYIRNRNFEIIPVAAVNDTQSVIEDGEVKQYPVPGFSSYNLETLIHWIADSVEELAPAIQEYYHQKYWQPPIPPIPLAPSLQPGSPITFANSTQTYQPQSSDSTPSKYSDVPYPNQLNRPAPKYTSAYFTNLWYIILICFLPILLFNLFNLYKVFSGNDIFYIYPPIFDSSFIKYYNIASIIGYSVSILLFYFCFNIIQDGYTTTRPVATLFLGISISLYLQSEQNPFAYLVADFLFFVFLFNLSWNLNRFIERHFLDVSFRATFLTLLFGVTTFLNRLFPFYYSYLLYDLKFSDQTVSILFLMLSIANFVFYMSALYSVMRTARDIQNIKMQQINS